MRVTHRTDELISLLQAYVLDGADVSEQRVRVALRLLDLALDDLPPQPPDDGDEMMPMLADADDQAMPVLRVAA